MEMLAENSTSIAQLCLWIWVVLTLFLFFYKGRKPFWLTVVNLLLLAGFVYFQWLI